MNRLKNYSQVNGFSFHTKKLQSLQLQNSICVFIWPEPAFTLSTHSQDPSTYFGLWRALITCSLCYQDVEKSLTILNNNLYFIHWLSFLQNNVQILNFQAISRYGKKLALVNSKILFTPWTQRALFILVGRASTRKPTPQFPGPIGDNQPYSITLMPVIQS